MRGGRNRWSYSLTRRQALTGLSAAGIATMTAGCGAEEDGDRYLRGPLSVDYDNADNPFGVNGRVPLDVVLFMGGFADDYATKGHEPMYREKFPKARIIHSATEVIEAAVGPRMQNSQPPDVLMNAGGERFDFNRLVRDGLLINLDTLLDAPSIDDPATKVRDTLRPRVADVGKLGDDDSVWGLPYGYAGYGLWYSRKLFEDNGWEEPASWDAFMELCASIKSAGIAPLAYPGRYPYYMLDPIVNLAVRHGGVAVVDGMLDDFGPDAFEHESLRESVDAWEEFVDKGYVMEGSNNMDHLSAQREWAKGEAAFVPCGSWLENEQREDIPSDFDMAFMPVPPLSGSKEPKRVMATPQDHFVLPKYANNPAGGLEYLRLMLSKEGSRVFTEHTASLNASAAGSVVSDQPGVKSLEPYLDDEDNLYSNHLETKYVSFAEDTVFKAIAQLMNGDLSASKFIDDLVEGAK